MKRKHFFDNIRIKKDYSEILLKKYYFTISVYFIMRPDFVFDIYAQLF